MNKSEKSILYPKWVTLKYFVSNKMLLNANQQDYSQMTIAN